MKELECFIENLAHLQLIVKEQPYGENKEKKKERLRHQKKLNDLQFIEKVEQEIVKLEPICLFIDKVQTSDCTISEVVDKWLDMKPLALHRESFEKRDKMFCSLPALIAYSLDPRFKGVKLSKQKKKQVDQALIHILRTQKDLDDLENFRKCLNIFGYESLKNMSPVNYWKLVADECPKFAEIALKYVTLPSSTASLERLFSMWKHVHSIVRNRLTNEHSEMLAFIYYSLDVNETVSKIALL